MRNGSTQYGKRQGGNGYEKKAESARPKRRAFCMTTEEAEEAPDVVTGTFW